jgi:hypothetical protein
MSGIFRTSHPKYSTQKTNHSFAGRKKGFSWSFYIFQSNQLYHRSAVWIVDIKDLS